MTQTFTIKHADLVGRSRGGYYVVRNGGELISGPWRNRNDADTKRVELEIDEARHEGLNATALEFARGRCNRDD